MIVSTSRNSINYSEISFVSDAPMWSGCPIETRSEGLTYARGKIEQMRAKFR